MTLNPPPGRQQASARLELALAKLEIGAREVARQAKAGGNTERFRARLTTAGAGVEQAAAALHLRCAEGGLGIGGFDTAKPDQDYRA